MEVLNEKFKFDVGKFWNHRQGRLRFVYTHFKSCDQSLDKISFDFRNIFRANRTKSSKILKISKIIVT